MPWNISGQLKHKVYYPQRQKTYLLACWPIEDSNRLRSDQSLRFPDDETASLAIQNTPREDFDLQAEIKFSWAHISDGTISDVTAHIRPLCHVIGKSVIALTNSNGSGEPSRLYIPQK